MSSWKAAAVSTFVALRFQLRLAASQPRLQLDISHWMLMRDTSKTKAKEKQTRTFPNVPLRQKTWMLILWPI